MCVTDSVSTDSSVQVSNVNGAVIDPVSFGG